MVIAEENNFLWVIDPPPMGGTPLGILKEKSIKNFYSENNIGVRLHIFSPNEIIKFNK